jgi:hypothetical protein
VATFDRYVKPECDIWDQRCIDIHQIHSEDERIVGAHNIHQVWLQFKTWLNSHVGMSETVILVAWNGENCNLKWLWKITQAPRSCLSFPPQIQFFIDPYRVITSFKSNRRYLWIFCWALDWVVHAQHSIMTFLAEQGIRKPEWKKYRDKNEGCHNFQINLGISLLNYGIGLDWDGVSANRPSYMRIGAFKPCDCKKCFFCLKGHTNGIAHRPQKQAKVTVEYKC